jgi:uracil-DNA glycosylase family 4
MKREGVSEKAALLEEIAEEVRQCQACPLHRGRNRVVPGEGSPEAKIMFIGEGPGAEEDAQGRPFVGPAGRYLNALLLRAGLRREEVFITNLVKCRPPGNREPTAEEVAACRIYLDGQIAALSPRVICLLGRPATAALLHPAATMSKIHGQVIERDGIYYIPLYHPAAALHSQRLGPVLNEDFDRLKSFFARIVADG